jgi:flavin-dependent dehydrogenase
MGRNGKADPKRDGSGLKLEQGSRVGVIGGGPAGSFFSYFLLQNAQRLNLDLKLDIFEPRDFNRRGPGNCNMCGGVISESLVQNLAGEGINIPKEIIQRRIDSYHLHMDVGSVLIPTPLREKRIASVHRGSGPRTFQPLNSNSFDGFLLDRATEKGANVIAERVGGVAWEDGWPVVETKGGRKERYDLLVGATGVNSGALKNFEMPGSRYKPPQSAKAYICEMYLGHSMVKRYIGSSMHIFLLDLPRVDFAAIIPKSDYVTICLLGEDIDKDVVKTFLKTREVKSCMPPLWRPPKEFCRCSPRINVASAVQPFADRVVFVGDSGTTKLYKDGIGAAYRTSKAAANTVAYWGVGQQDFKHHYLPVCKKIEADNQIGKFLFGVTRQIQTRRYARRCVWKMVSDEQNRSEKKRRLSVVLWDIFTGSAPYRSVLKRTMHPVFSVNMAWNLVAANRKKAQSKPKRRSRMPIPGTDALGKCFKDGEIIYRQGERGDCMYVVQKGKAEVMHRDEDKEFLLAELTDGDFFGEMALFEGETRRATVRAIGETWVYTLERDSLFRRIDEDPSLAFRLIQQMSYRIRELETKLVRTSRAAY